ncbi:MAG: methionine--tRNA ligase [Candidatus Aenigmarchaeota archaeon]|nr:methionine--tRNA ligase [Candidatus Aenigmarchaeota archaeon]
MKKVSKLNKFYITTAIPYVNSDPHIGHALEFIQTDAIKRFHELLGKSAFLVTGADENSLKNVQAAEQEGIPTKQLCDKYTEKFKEAMKALNLSFDGFMRSSGREHFAGSQKLWKLCSKDIYKKKYKGLYCVGCEAFYTKSELADGKCPEHKKEPEIVEEENYFFRLSRYQKQLEKLIENNELKVIPETRKNEVLSFIRSGLEDFSVSRSTARAKGWGVPVPGDESQIQYVWFDALNVYQTGVGFGFDDKLYKKWWPCDLHVIGKGIIRFHAVYWPAILLSAGLKLPKALFVHGYITINGEKISKSLGNVINPLSMVGKYGADQLRYYMIRDISPFNDGDFSEKSLVERVNEELVSNYSNLFYRVTSFIEKNFDSRIPAGKEDRGIFKIIEDKIAEYKKKMGELRLNEALEVAIALSGEGNNYFQKKRPWETIKTNKKDCAVALYNGSSILATVSSLLYPFIPESAEKALEALGIGGSSFKARIKAGTKINALMLFKNIEPKDVDKGEASPEKGEIKMVGGEIPFKEFQKLDLRIGTVTDVKDHPNADKLFVLQVDLDTEKRQLVVGMRGIYKKEELKGKQVIVVCNLEPKDMRGVRSEGMILAADDATLLSPVKKVENGMKVR